MSCKLYIVIVNIIFKKTITYTCVCKTSALMSKPLTLSLVKLHKQKNICTRHILIRGLKISFWPKPEISVIFFYKYKLLSILMILFVPTIGVTVSIREIDETILKRGVDDLDSTCKGNNLRTCVFFFSMKLQMDRYPSNIILVSRL